MPAIKRLSRKRIVHKTKKYKTKKNKTQKGGFNWLFSSSSPSISITNFDDTSDNIKNIRNQLNVFVEKNTKYKTLQDGKLLEKVKNAIKNTTVLDALINDNNLRGNNEDYVQGVLYSNLMQNIETYVNNQKINKKQIWGKLIKLFDSSNNLDKQEYQKHKFRLARNNEKSGMNKSNTSYVKNNSGTIKSNKIATSLFVNYLYRLLDNSDTDVSKFAEFCLAQILFNANPDFLRSIEEQLQIRSKLI